MQPDNIEEIYPLSPMQQGVLFHSLYEPEAAHYFRQWSCRFRGPLDASALGRAWQEVVNRHSILRTAFVWEETEEPLQVVCQRVEIPIERQDWRRLSVRQQEERLAAYLVADQRRGFEFSEAPLIRLALFQEAEDAFRMIWSFHHILLDGWSVALVVRQVVSCYMSWRQGAYPPNDRSRPFRDYVAWLKGRDLGAAEAFWRHNLRGFLAPNVLYVDRGLEAARGDREDGVANLTLQLGSTLTTDLQALAQRHQITLNTLVQGFWAILVGHYSGDRDVVFGATVSGRPTELAGFESMVGLFINTLPVRAELSGSGRLLSWIKDLQTQQAEARRFEFSPLVQVQKWSDVAAGSPLFHTILVFENYRLSEPAPEAEEELSVEDTRFLDGSNYPLSLIVRPGERLKIRAIYEPRRFETSSVRRLLENFQTLAKELVDRPEARLAGLSLLRSSGRQQLLVEWNATRRTYPESRCLHELVERQVERSPEAPAVLFEGQSRSYRELDQRANQLAHHLRGMGVGPEVLVAVAVERSLELVVSLLGVLKAGGAYLPLDPSYPVSRLGYMLEDSGAAVLLTQERLLAVLPSEVPATVCLDRDAERIAAASIASPRVAMDPSALAYVIYTSGSTGRPKGAQIPHRALVNFLWSMRQQPGLKSGERLLAVTSLSFDISALEIYLPLLVGAEVEVVSSELSADGPRLLQRLASADVLQATPASWQLLIESGWQAGGGLRALCGGEALSPRLASELSARSAAVWNLYGPTETTIWSTLKPVVLPVHGADGPVAIGRPIANTQIYVLDSSLQALPIAVPGQLYIGGTGVARGYLARARLSAERFVPDPFPESGPGGRLYATGDLTRWLPSCELSFLGRLDHQVKVRGFRIELGEIEAVLEQHLEISRAVVVARREADDHRLVAYLTVVEGAAPANGELRRHLRSRLPDYMVPAVFLMLPTLPLLPNGKVDRGALPAPDWGPANEMLDTAPRTPVEELLAGIWEEILHRDSVGIHDNFFELGGHSLLAIRVLSRLRKTLSVELSLRELFTAPTVSALAARVETVRRSGRALAPPLVPLAGSRNLPVELRPLSFSQERLWFLDRLEPGSSVYNLSTALRLTGALQIAALHGALIEVVRRHETLRTTFLEVEGEAVQRTQAPGVPSYRPPSLPLVDLGALRSVDSEHQANRLAAEEARRPFDLEQGPLLRWRLLRLAEEEHVVLAAMHHIISDGWSMGVLSREVGSLYSNLESGTPSTLPPLVIQYGDYAQWQRDWLQGDVLAKEVSYWRDRLAGLPAVLDLPTDRPRPAARSFRGGSVRLELPNAVQRSLSELARSEGATLFMTLLAAFQLLLGRLSGRQDICVGTPVAGRSHEETEGLIGFLVNTLVLRAELSEDPAFRDLLEQVRETTLAAHEHQALPFEKLVEELQPDRNLSHSPLFQVMFMFQNAPPLELGVTGLKVQGLGTPSSTAKFDLTLAMAEGSAGLRGTLEYNTDLFDSTTIRRLAESFENLLAAITADPHRRLSQLELFSRSQRHALLVEWNDTRTSYLRDRPIHELFEEQVELNPDRIALVFEGFGQPEPVHASQVTYRQLNREADHLAHDLRRRGVGPGSVVAVAVERSVEMVVGLLGILKAGGAYLPLDPSYPYERQAFVLQDSATALILTQERLLTDLPEHSAHRICLDRDRSEARGTPGPAVPVDPDSLAYVIYTSGSTGKPKGAMVSHRGITNRLLWMQEAFGLGAEDRVLQKTPFSFDVSVWEFFWPLMTGAGLVMARPGGHEDPAYLVRTIGSQRITTLHFVPSMLQVFLEHPEVETCRPIRQVICSGEALPEVLRQRYYQRLEAPLHNLYGPTEAAVDVTFWPCPPAGELLAVPIGRAIANTRIHVLDRLGNPVLQGSAGELRIGGIQLARGYLGRPGLTAERFVPDSLSTQCGARSYRTGDLVRYLAAGDVEFLGRIDHQVKVRGFRIELGEIETVLEQHPGVSRAVVVAHREAGDDRLVAYLTAPVEAAPPNGELREYLRSRVPDYMVPTAFMTLPELPLLPNGKVDRGALPAPVWGPADETLYAVPRNPVEELLVGIWAEILHLDSVGTRDNFFELGGHSLLAIRVIARLRQAFGVEIALRELFEAPTVAELAVKIAAGLAAESKPVPQLVVAARDGALPLSFSQLRLWFLDQWEPGSPAYNLALSVSVRGNLHTVALAAALRAVVRRHEVLRTRFVVRDEQPEQVIEDDPVLPFHAVDLRRLSAEHRRLETRRIARGEAYWSFRLERLPLFRATLLQVGDGEWRLLFTVHHIVTDGWSFGILFRDLATFYQAGLNGEPLLLPELPLQYADYAIWQRGWLEGGVLEEQLAYWRRRLTGGGSPPLELSTDRPRSAVQSFRGGRQRWHVPRELTDRLKALGHREGATPFMVLLAALKTLLYRYTSQSDLSVGTFTAGRGQVELESLIGFFVNTLVLRTDLGDNPPFRELLGRIKEETLGAYSHQDVPFEKILEELQLERDLSRTPLFQVMLVLQNVPKSTIELPELTLERSGAGRQGRANFDLTLWLSETPEGLSGQLDYSSDLFDVATVCRLLDHFTLLLAGIVEQPDQRLSDLPLLGAEEERRLLVEWNDTATPLAEQRYVHQLFEAQAVADPLSVALREGERRLSYRELNEWANRLAHHLRDQGVGPEVVVGVCLHRSVEMMVCVLAVLKAGGAYLPLDPEYPAQRLSYLLADSGAAMVLTAERLLASLPTTELGQRGVPTFTLEHEAEAIAVASAADPPPPTANHLAYVIYTSGSTGRPKGVAVSHRSLLHHTLDAVATYALGSEDRVLQFAPLSFDASAEEIYSCWAAGAQLVLRNDAMLASVPDFLQVCRRWRITILNLPTAYWHEVAASLEALPPAVRLVILGGEKARPERLTAWRRTVDPAVRLFNTYGPTEATVVASRCELEREILAETEVPIGRAIGNVLLYVLDRGLGPVPVDVAGELHIAGVGLARGYLGQPRQTAARFLPNPFAAGLGAFGGRLYKTGDRARWRLDGQLECLGRVDFQVKIRGYRIELGEIEASLQQHQAIREAVVVARSDQGEEELRLVAYGVAKDRSVVTAGELLAHLRERLPDYMVPSAFVLLPEMPKTMAGKLDRQALPAPDRSRPQLERQYVAPRTASEEALAEVVSELLSIDQVGVYDSFFDLGGHSLVATQYLSRIRELFEIELPLRIIFETPSVASLAVTVEEMILAELEALEDEERSEGSEI